MKLEVALAMLDIRVAPLAGAWIETVFLSL